MTNPVLVWIKRLQRIAELRRLIVAEEEKARLAALHAARILTPAHSERGWKRSRVHEAQAERYKREIVSLGGKVDVSV